MSDTMGTTTPPSGDDHDDAAGTTDDAVPTTDPNPDPLAAMRAAIFGDHEQRITSNTERIGTAEQRLDAQDETLTGVRRAVSQVSTAVEAIDIGALAALRQEIEGVPARIDEVDGRVTTVAGRVDDVEERVDDVETSLTALRRRVDQQGEDAAAIIGTVNHNTEDAHTRIDGINGDIVANDPDNSRGALLVIGAIAGLVIGYIGARASGVWYNEAFENLTGWRIMWCVVSALVGGILLWAFVPQNVTYRFVPRIPNRQRPERPAPDEDTPAAADNPPQGAPTTVTPAVPVGVAPSPTPTPAPAPIPAAPAATTTP